MSYGGYSDWRLPTTPHALSSFGFSKTSSEMGRLFHNELGNKSAFNTSGEPQADYGLVNSGPFKNVQNVYWSRTENANDLSFAWTFSPYSGSQVDYDKPYELYAWVVPPTMLAYTCAACRVVIRRWFVRIAWLETCRQHRVIRCIDLAPMLELGNQISPLYFLPI